MAAGIPSDVTVCAACGLAVERGNVLVCDGCELGFHLGCAEMPGQKEVVLEEWLCGKCESNEVRCNRWPLGAAKGGIKRKNSGINNALSSGNGEGEDLSVLRY